MGKKLISLWDRFSIWFGDKMHKPKTLSQIIEEDNKVDRVEIEQCEKTITGQQFLLHMATARIAARNEWTRLQEAGKRAAAVPNHETTH